MCVGMEKGQKCLVPFDDDHDLRIFCAIAGCIIFSQFVCLGLTCLLPFTQHAS